jgi:hypothetical protein
MLEVSCMTAVAKLHGQRPQVRQLPIGSFVSAQHQRAVKQLCFRLASRPARYRYYREPIQEGTTGLLHNDGHGMPAHSHLTQSSHAAS